MIEITGPLRTERPVLRPFTLDDADDTLAFESREDIVRYVPYGPRDAEENARQVARRAEQTSLSLTLSGILDFPTSGAQGSPGLRPGYLALIEVVLEGRGSAGCGRFLDRW